MGKAIFRLPSKGTVYGYVEVEFDVDDNMNAHQLGAWYTEYVNNFQRGEVSAKAKPIQDRLAEAIVTTVADTGAIKTLGESFGEAARKGVLDEQFGSNFREPTPEEAESLITEELGATNITDIMNEDVEEEAAPYEEPPAKPSDDDWDF